ncbi:MAG: adenylate/guanylate cyclase domain-containing protein [Desulfobacteraceae bacterium]|jgi:class 3 adenylate cyclase/tetratricopeptide (TPR) repeat protein
MKCPKCQFENPETARFCVECGDKLEIICPNCGFINSPSFKFCAECGQNLSLLSEPSTKEPSLDEKIAKIQKYLPKGLVEKILVQRNKIEGERKQLTVMFCDMEGFTGLSERLGPEQAYEIMDQVYEILIHKVHDYEGTVNEMTGDGIMALFGAPIALEDAPQRAIRSAMAIHREMVRFSDKRREERQGIPPLKMRVGIHTGPVVVGTLGNDLRVEFKAVGDTVNLASRMEGLAEPGSTYLTEDTFRLTEGFFRYEALGQKQVKGREEPVNVYRVIAPSTRRTRFDVSAERGLTPFMGRERELELLLDGFERAKAGRGQAFSIMAEAGLGKSRLLYEFRKAVSNEDATFLEGKCLSYSRGVAHHPLIDILKANFDIRETDGDSEIREKSKRGLKIIGAQKASTLPFFLELLSVKDSGIDKIPMSPEAKKDGIMEAFKEIILRGSEIRPLIMAFEDLHWVDKSSEDVLKYVLESIPGVRVFLIFTYRPDFVHTWGAKSYHNQITLGRLSNRESLAMVKHLLDTEEIDGDLEALVLEKTEGVPFFIEEFIKSLRELKVIERRDSRYHLAKDIQHVAIPSTIQDVIMARVDSLHEGAKELLQAGSVIEREFSYPLIKRLTGLPEQELLFHMSALKDSELLYERGIFPQSTYIFKHALTREVVNDSILTRKKRHLHEEIGNAIEALYPDRIEEQYELLAHHYGLAEDWERAVHFGRLAAEKAHKFGQLQQAVTLYEQTTEWLLKLPENKIRQESLADIQLGICWGNLNLGQFEKVEEVGLQAESAAKMLGDRVRLGMIYLVIGTAYVYRGNFKKSEHYDLQAIQYLEGTGQEVGLATANFILGGCYIGQGLWRKSEPHISKAVRAYEKVDKKTEYAIGWNMLGYSLGCAQLGYNLGVMGRVAKAKELFEKGYTPELEQVSDLTTMMPYCSWQGLFVSLIGEDHFGAASRMDQMEELAERSDSPFMILVFSLAKVNILLGMEDFGLALSTCQKALKAIEGKPIRTGHVVNLYYDLVLAQLGSGDQQSAKQYYEQGRPLVELAPHWWEPRFDFLQGLLLMGEASPNYMRAEECFQKSIRGDEEVGAVVPAAQTRYHLARMLARKGEAKRCREMLTELASHFQSWGIHVWQQKCEQELEHPESLRKNSPAIKIE